MIQEETIFLMPSKWQTVNPDWCVARRLEIEHGEVTIQMIMRELCVNWDKARKILQRWESMKEAKILQEKFGRDDGN